MDCEDIDQVTSFVLSLSILAVKVAVVVKGTLTLSQTTNFRLFQTERVCR